MTVGIQIVIIGAGGLARDVVDIFQAINQRDPGSYNVLGYIVDEAYGAPDTLVYGKPILGDFGWFAGRLHEVEVICAVGSSDDRYQLARKAATMGVRFGRAVHPQACLSPGTQLGEGVIIKAGCLTASQVILGEHVVLNLGCTIGHDTTLDDYVTAAAGVNLAGYVKVGQGVHLSIGTKIIERIAIGEWAFIGAGSVVNKNIGPHTTAAGIPARVIKGNGAAKGKENFNEQAPC